MWLYILGSPSHDIVHCEPGLKIIFPEHTVNKQLADKERVAAAMENNNLLDVVNQCLTIKSN